MQFKILLTGSVLGVLGLIMRIQAVPIEVIYTGDSCDCPKKLNYLVNMPIPSEPIDYKPSEYGYNVERPPSPKARVTYSFDFMVEEPKKPIPPPEVKWDLFAKIDRIAANKKDCYAVEKVTKPCGCNPYPYAFDNSRYVSTESAAPRFTRNLKHPNSIDNMVQSPPLPTAHVMAIFFKPLKQTNSGVSKSRNKRAIARIFMRPRTKAKRSDRLVKKYNKGLKDSFLGEEKTFYDDAEKSIRSRGIVSAEPIGIHPLQQLKRFLTLPNLRNKRDIKGEYDLLEKEREQMDLTLPEIIQYMPETLNPNFQRSQCSFGQSCQHPEQLESTTKTTTTTSATNETSTMIPTKEKDSKNSNKDTLSANKANSLQDKEKENTRMNDNSISPTHIKRNVRYYTNDGCPSVSKENSPTPSRSYTYEPIRGPIANVANDYGSDPLPQQYVGSSYNPYSSVIIDNDPLLRAGNAKSTIQTISNAQLDRLIAGIVNKHSDFIEASSHQGGALVDPPQIQREQVKYFIKNLGPWNDLPRLRRHTHHYHHHHQYPKVQAHLRHFRTPRATYVQKVTTHYK